MLDARIPLLRRKSPIHNKPLGNELFETPTVTNLVCQKVAYCHPASSVRNNIRVGITNKNARIQK